VVSNKQFDLSRTFLIVSETRENYVTRIVGNSAPKSNGSRHTVEYKCHAGLHCVVTPIEIEGRAKLAVIGGRAFVRSEDYQSLISRI
jgi:ligand-binding sensor protein